MKRPANTLTLFTAHVIQNTRAGWSSEINQLLIGKALSDEFDGRILNPHGVEIDLPFRVFKRLKKLHLLERDGATGRRRIKAPIFGVMDFWDGPDFRPDRRFRAFDPAYQKACSKDSGYASAFLKALGRDCSGLPHPAAERSRDFESDLSHTRVSDEYRRVKAEEVVRAVRAKRRAA